MGIFSRKKEVRENMLNEEAVTDTLLRALRPLSSITVEQALSVPSLTGSIEYIANAIAMLPIKLYEENESEVSEIEGDWRVRLLNDDTGDTLNPYQMKKAFVRDCLLSGAGYIYINKEFNEVKSLHYVKHSAVNINTDTDPIFKKSEILVNGKPYYPFEFIKLTRNTEDGVRGIGIVEESNDILTVAYNSLLFERRLAKNGGNKKGFLQSEKRLSTEAIETIKAAWKELYSDNSDNMIVLNDGIKFQESSNTLVEMQLNENKITNGAEICKLLNLSPDIIAGKATDAQYNTAFKVAVLPYITAFETALNRDLLLEQEKETKYFVIDISEALKGDVLKRYQAYEVALRANFMQPDEVRYKEDLKPLGLNFIKLGLSDVLYDPVSKTVYTPNTNKTNNISTGEGGEKNED